MMDRMIDEIFLPIASAPRNGTEVIVGHEDVGTFLMKWSDTATNDFHAPGEVGMWVCPGGMMTWCSDGGGPTHWKPSDIKGMH